MSATSHQKPTASHKTRDDVQLLAISLGVFATGTLSYVFVPDVAFSQACDLIPVETGMFLAVLGVATAILPAVDLLDGLRASRDAADLAKARRKLDR